MTLTRNLASWDRMLRLILGAALVILAVMGSIGVWGWLGLVLVGTASVNFCPIYKVLGVKTCTDC